MPAYPGGPFYCDEVELILCWGPAYPIRSLNFINLFIIFKNIINKFTIDVLLTISVLLVFMITIKSRGRVYFFLRILLLNLRRVIPLIPIVGGDVLVQLFLITSGS